MCRSSRDAQKISLRHLATESMAVLPVSSMSSAVPPGAPPAAAHLGATAAESRNSSGTAQCYQEGDAGNDQLPPEGPISPDTVHPQPHRLEICIFLIGRRILIIHGGRGDTADRRRLSSC